MITWQLPFAFLFGFASVIEWMHFRDAMQSGDPIKMIGTAVAAIATGFIASECLRGEWRIGI